MCYFNFLRKGLRIMRNSFVVYLILVVILSGSFGCSDDDSSDKGRRIAGTVQLEEGSDHSAIQIFLRSENDEVLAEKAAASDGAYEFTELNAGTYILEFESGNENYENARIIAIIVTEEKTTTVDRILRLVTRITSSIRSDETWTKENSPYRIEHPIDIDENVTLTVQAGTEIHFEENCGLDIEGTLKALGAVGDTILFTSAKAHPERESWTGIYATQSAQNSEISEIKYCLIEYAVVGITGDRVCVEVSRSQIKDCRIGIKIDHTSGCDWIISNNVIQNNTEEGIKVEDSGNVTIENNLFSNDYDIYFDGGPLQPNQVEHNLFQGNRGIVIQGLGFGRELDITNNIFQVGNVAVTCKVNSYPTIHGNNFLSAERFIYIDFGCHIVGDITYYCHQDDQDIDAEENYWGSTDSEYIYSKILDRNNCPESECNTSLCVCGEDFGAVSYANFRSAENPNAGPR